MSKKEKETAVDSEQTVSYKDVVYKASELSPIQIDNFNHMADLKRKIDQATFNVRQLQGGIKHFEYELDESLKEAKDESE